MAAIAEPYSVKRGAAKAPVSAHPAFPAIVALWFAALIGLGSLVLPLSLIERLFVAAGIAALVPAVAPPLGFTAHAAIALGGAICGALLGLVLARKVAASQAAERASWRPEAALRCRPISAHEELGEEGLGASSAPSLIAQKRRTLTMAEEDTRSAYLEVAPLPGHASEPQAMAADGPIAGIADEPLPEALELTELAEEGDAPATAPDPALEALRSRIHLPVERADNQDDPMTDEQPFDLRSADEPAVAANPLPFAAPSLRRFDPLPLDDEAETSELADSAPAEPAVPQLQVVATHVDDTGEEEPATDAPLEDLGLAQLAARLGASLKKRQAQRLVPAPVPPLSVAPLAPEGDFQSADADEAARAIADFFARPAAEAMVGEDEPVEAIPAIPTSLQDAILDAADDLDEVDDCLSLALPVGRGAAPAAASATDDSEAEQAADADGDYSSLLAMKNPFVRQQEFVRVELPEDESSEIEPTVTFPKVATAGRQATIEPLARPFDPPRNPPKSVAAAPVRNSGEAQRSLRDALATLQRMNGAA